MTVRHHTHADAIEAATRGLVARLAAQAEELAELRQRDRVISHQLDQRAGGRDAFTQALLAELDAEKDKVKAQAERIAALERDAEQCIHPAEGEAVRLREQIATLRRWMAEYPNDKYTGAWWLAEFDRIAGKAGQA
jgi:chromosome segregation ATPase